MAAVSCHGGVLAQALGLSVRETLVDGVETVGIDTQAVALKAGGGGAVALENVERDSGTAQPLRETQAAKAGADDGDMQGRHDFR